MWYLMGIKVVPIPRFQREQDKPPLRSAEPYPTKRTPCPLTASTRDQRSFQKTMGQ